MRRLIIAGSREFNDYARLSKVVSCLTRGWGNFEIVSGRCRGADRLGERYAREYGIPLKVFPAEWERYGKGAGPIRNQEMANYATHCIVFLGENSRGSKNMVETAKRYKLKVKTIRI